jgi:hypothetical protein
LSITGNAGQGGNANNIGIDLTTSALVAVQGGAGNLTLTGTGRGTGHDNYGLVIQAGALAKVMPSAGGTGGTGSLTLTGTGGNGSYANYGVYFTSSTMQVSTVGSALSVFGYGGQGSFGGNIGIEAYNAGLVSVAAGMGKLTFNGTAGSGTNVCAGVYLYGSTTQVTTAGGDLAITGTGKGSTNNCDGIDVMSGAKVAAAGGGNVFLTGYGGNGGTALDLGVQVNGAIVQATGSGSVTLNGTGGAGTSATVSNYGVIVQGSGAQVTTAGGALTITGTGGQGANNYNIGVDVYRALVAVQGGTGNLTLGGTGAGTGANNWGITLQAGAVVQVVPSSQGTGGTGTLTLGGIGGKGTNFNDGVFITNSGTKVTTAGSPLVINGTGQGSGYDNTGIEIGYGALVSAGDAGSLTLNGTGGNGTSGNVGVDIYAGTTTPTTQVSTTAGALSITGFGRGSGTNNYGIWVEAAARVSAGAGALTLTGTGGNGTDSDHGVVITDPGTQLRTTDGTLSITGTAGAGPNSYAVDLASHAYVGTTGAGNISVAADSLNIDTTAAIDAGYFSAHPNTATITPETPGTVLNFGGADAPGTLGISANEFYQIFAGTINLGDANTGTFTVSAAIHDEIDANLNLTTGSNLVFDPGSRLDSYSGNLTLRGASGMLFNPGSRLTSVNGNLGLNPDKLPEEKISLNYAGVEVNKATIETSGSGNVWLTGTGGGSGNNNYGLEINNAVIETTGSGNVQLQGKGGDSGWSGGAGNYGIYIHGGSSVQAMGTGSFLELTGIGGSGTSDDVGIRIDGSGTEVACQGALPAGLSILGQAGDNSSIDIALSNGGLLKGTGSIVGNVSNGGVLNPGFAPGTISLWGGTSYTQTPAGDLEIKIGGYNTPGNQQHDQVYVTGTVTLAGTLGVQLVNGFNPKPGDSFTIITGASVSGTFANASIPAGAGAFHISYQSKAVVLTYLADTTTSPVTANVNPSVYGQPVAISAAVSAVLQGEGTPTGMVMFLDNGVSLDTANLNDAGIATLMTTSLPAGTHLITATYLGDANFGRSTTPAPLVEVVNPAPLTVTAANQVMTYGGGVPALTYTYTGLVNGDSAACFTGALATAATGSSNVGTYPITAGTLAATGDYTIATFNPGTLTVKPATLTITANSTSKTYGQAVTFHGTEFTTGGLVNGDKVTSVTLTSPGAAATAPVAGSPYAITPAAAQGTGLANYTISYANGTLTVKPAALTVTANDQTKITGEKNPAFTVSYSGFVLGQGPGVLDGTLTFSTPATTASPPGTYAITPGGLTSGNYAITFVNGTLTVLSYAQATTNLLAKVDAAGLPHGTQNSLDSKLQAAVKSFNGGNTKAGANQLGAFINEVSAQRGKKIDAALADALIADAQRIINAVD